MKKIILSAILLFAGLAVWAQAPQFFNYQGVVRNATTGAPLQNTLVGLELTIHDGSALGTPVYKETFTPTTNEFGLYNVAVGSGTVVLGTFSTIDWSTGNKYMEVALDPTGGATYASLGTSELLSVPYALFAANALGDNWGTQVAITDTTLAGNGTTASPLKIAQHGATTGEALVWNGTSWMPTSSNAWKITGNAGTHSGTNFIGTTDTAALRLRVDNKWAGEINATTENVSFGPWAGLTGAGTYNVAIGDSALISTTTGNFNTAVGDYALNSNTTGVSNAAFGIDALASNTSGAWNTAIGTDALVYGTNDTENTAVGSGALFTTTSGSYNTAVGENALYENSTGKSNTAVGIAALQNTTGSWNTGVGEGALLNGLTDTGNVGVGNEVLYNNTTGNYNVALGSQALENDTTGSWNVAIGWQALTATNANQNIAIGQQAMLSNKTGWQNVAVGTFALYNNTTGIWNLCMGLNSLASNLTGNYNTAIGHSSGVTAAALTNTTVLGYGASVSISNKAVIGNSSVTVIGGYANWTNLSDGRFKTDIKENVPGLDFITKLRPVTYRLQARKFERFQGTPDSVVDKISGSYDKAEALVRTGFVAQDVEKAAQEAGFDFSGLHKPETDRDNYSLAYAEFTVPLVKAVQELSAQNAAQQKTIEELQLQIAAMMKQIEKLAPQK